MELKLIYRGYKAYILSAGYFKFGVHFLESWHKIDPDN